MGHCHVNKQNKQVLGSSLVVDQGPVFVELAYPTSACVDSLCPLVFFYNQKHAN